MGKLAAGETIRVKLDRESEASMMLRNGGGWILLYEKDARRAAVEYDSSREAAVTNF